MYSPNPYKVRCEKPGGELSVVAYTFSSSTWEADTGTRLSSSPAKGRHIDSSEIPKQDRRKLVVLIYSSIDGTGRTGTEIP